MLKRVVHLSVTSFMFLFASACAGGSDDGGATFGTFTTQSTFGADGNDDMGDAETSDSAGDGDGEPTSGDGDGEPTSGDGDGEPTSGDGDGEPATSGDGDGDGDGEPGPDCGNGVLDPGETCDGNDFGGVTCVDLGYDEGALSCNACAVSTATCSNAPQPGVGMLYSHCLDIDNCPNLDGCATVSMEGEDVPFDGYCTNFCTVDADCAANTGGTAVPQCNEEASPFCELDCSGGKTCPDGMVCTSLQGGKKLCY